MERHDAIVVATNDAERDVLVVCVAEQQDKIRNLKRQLKSTQQYARRVVARLEQTQRQLVLVTSGQNKSLDITRVGTSRHLTVEGSFALAIRKNIGTCSARSLGATLLDSASHSTVCISEIRCAAALLGAARLFCRQAGTSLTWGGLCKRPLPSIRESWRVRFFEPIELCPLVLHSFGFEISTALRMDPHISSANPTERFNEAYSAYDVMHSGTMPPPAPQPQPPQHCDREDFHIILVAFRADATNTIIAMESKVHNLEAEIMSKTRVADVYCEEGPLRQQADLQYLPDGTAAAVHSTIRKQLRSLGVRDWLHEDVIDAPRARPEVRGPGTVVYMLLPEIRSTFRNLSRRPHKLCTRLLDCVKRSVASVQTRRTPHVPYGPTVREHVVLYHSLIHRFVKSLRIWRRLTRARTNPR